MEKKLYKRRREFLELAGLGLLSALAAGDIEGAEIRAVEFKALGKDACIDIGQRAKDIIQEGYELGREYEGRHGGCCRCTVAAAQRAIDFVPRDEDVFRAACCLDGGATPTGMQNCGAFTGSGIIIGYLCGTKPFGNTGLAHKLIRQVYERFKESYGTVLCKDVREKGEGNCPEIVGKAAQWTIEMILRQFTNYGKELTG